MRGSPTPRTTATRPVIVSSVPESTPPTISPMSQGVLERVRNPGRRVGVGIRGRQSSQFTAGGIQPRSVGRVTNIGDPDCRRPKTLRALTVAKSRGTGQGRVGVGHAVR